jgi:glycosyltransferase involved in cell wall biosynthesis
MLAPAVVEARVIPNGVDLRIFHPADRRRARAELGIPEDARVLLFAAKHPRDNVWKDYPTMRAAAGLVAERLQGQRVLFIALGEDAPAERAGQARVRYVPFQHSSEAVARYYQAADVYVHAARAENFPNVVLEALACGTPVVASAVGGIPEQVRGLRTADGELRGRDGGLNSHSAHEATGVLLPPGDVKAMAAGIVALLTDDALRSQLGTNAARDARERFDLNRLVEAYLRWYQEIVQRRNGEGSAS